MIFFKFPLNPAFYTIIGGEGNHCVEFVSFDEQKSVKFSGRIKEISREDLLKHKIPTNDLKRHAADFEQESAASYIKKLSEVISFIKDEHLKKLVISRRKFKQYADISEDGAFSLTKTFINLCESYPNAFVYIFKKETVWMGAFSEILGKFNKKNKAFETMSLAGTLPVDEEWTEKEIEEQKPVTEYIFNILSKFSENIQVSETYNHISGNIKHLRTDFATTIQESDLQKLITELHPTPAVCGIPKDFCRSAISKFEKHDRELYAGYIRIETDDDIIYHVNLRCAEFTDNGVCMYVGGGITAKSDPEKEWRETELKSEAILKNIAIS